MLYNPFESCQNLHYDKIKGLLELRNDVNKLDKRSELANIETNKKVLAWMPMLYWLLVTEKLLTNSLQENSFG